MDKCNTGGGSQPSEEEGTEGTALENDEEVKPKPPYPPNEKILNQEILPLGSSKMPKHF